MANLCRLVSGMGQSLCQASWWNGCKTQGYHCWRKHLYSICKGGNVKNQCILRAVNATPLMQRNSVHSLCCDKSSLSILKPAQVVYGQRDGLFVCTQKHSGKILGRVTDSGNLGVMEMSQVTATPDTGWVIRLANENGYLSWCRNTYLATVVGVGMWAEGPSSVAFHATEGALFLGGLNLVLGTVSYLHTILRLRRKIHMSVIGAGLHVLAALTHLGIWLTVVVTYMGYVEAEEEVRHPGPCLSTAIPPNTRVTNRTKQP